MRENGGKIDIPRVEIVDWPTCPVRLFKTSATIIDPRIVDLFMRKAPRYKLNIYALQYHPLNAYGRKAEPKGSWREPEARLLAFTVQKRDGSLLDLISDESAHD